MKYHFNGNNQAKKLLEAINNIIFLLTGKQEGQKQSTGGTSTSTTKQTVNLLDIVIVQFILYQGSTEDKPVEEKSKFKKDTSNNSKQETDLLNLGSGSQQQDQNKKGFSFIKKTANENPVTTSNTNNLFVSNSPKTTGYQQPQQGNPGNSAKPGFSFIKKANDSNNTNTNVAKSNNIDFGEIFTSNTSNNNNIQQQNSIILNSLNQNFNTLDLTKGTL